MLKEPAENTRVPITTPARYHTARSPLYPTTTWSVYLNVSFAFVLLLDSRIPPPCTAATMDLLSAAALLRSAENFVAKGPVVQVRAPVAAKKKAPKAKPKQAVAQIKATMGKQGKGKAPKAAKAKQPVKEKAATIAVQKEVTAVLVASLPQDTATSNNDDDSTSNRYSTHARTHGSGTWCA